MSKSDLQAQADTAIRRQMNRILSDKTSYMVERDGKPALLGIGAPVVNAIIELFNSQI